MSMLDRFEMFTLPYDIYNFRCTGRHEAYGKVLVGVLGGACYCLFAHPPKNRLVSGSIPDRGRVYVHVLIRIAKCLTFGVHLGGIWLRNGTRNAPKEPK